MRLIDADELLETINNQDNWIGQMELSQMANINIYSLVNSMPTVEERPLGKWTTKQGSLEITCSVCNKGYFYHPNNDFYYNFCPHCGAYMWKEANNE